MHDRNTLICYFCDRVKVFLRYSMRSLRSFPFRTPMYIIFVPFPLLRKIGRRTWFVVRYRASEQHTQEQHTLDILSCTLMDQAVGSIFLDGVAGRAFVFEKLGSFCFAHFLDSVSLLRVCLAPSADGECCDDPSVAEASVSFVSTSCG